MTDWNPGAYARFRGLRLRPAMDLLAQVGGIPDGVVVDLGCGDGAVAPPLRQAFPGHDLIGIDSSPAMLAQARGYDRTEVCDIADWQMKGTVALIFSNAALHWLGDHARLLPRLAANLMPGGVLAVQMPDQFLAPSHRILRDLAETMFPDRFDFADYHPPVLTAAEYWDILAPLGVATIWETTYLQPLSAATAGHPVRAFTESTAMRPFLAQLDPEAAQAFTGAYDAALAVPYPIQPDGGALMPFRRLFMVLRVTG